MIAGQARFSAACAKLPTARAASNRNGNGRRRRIIFGNSMTAESVQGRRRPVTRGYLRSRGVYCVCGEAQCHLQTASLRSEEHTSELQSLLRISYAVFCLKQKKYIQ